MALHGPHQPAQKSTISGMPLPARCFLKRSPVRATGAPSNAAALATRAAERAADWLRERRYYGRPVLR
jgi:hypothetical protein